MCGLKLFVLFAAFMIFLPWLISIFKESSVPLCEIQYSSKIYASQCCCKRGLFTSISMSSFYSLFEWVCETPILESEQGQLLCWHCPTALAVCFFWVDRGATKVVSHCCIDRYSNYNLPHSIPISIKHQRALKVSLYACQMEQKLNIQWLWHSKRDTDPFLGVRHQIVSWIHGWRIWYDF